MSFTILTGKEGASPKRPLFLVTITAPDGDITYLTTAASIGGANIVYSGNTYLARIQSNEIQAVQAQGPQGFDSVPGFTMTLADADKALWTGHCMTHGWRGAQILLTVILWDVVAGAYSTDALQWSFIGGNPQHNHAAGTTTLDVTASTNFARLKVPSIPLEFRCPWDFPTTAAQRAAALNDPTSPYYQCGYSADQAGGIGNYQSGSTPFTTCDYTRSSPTDPSVGCMARLGNAATTAVAPDGDLEHDKAGNYTARFGGVTWIAPSQYSGRQYTTGQKTFGFNQPNTALAGSYYNWVTGTQWVQGQVLAPAGDPNSLRSEVAVCVAAFGPCMVQKVLVNGVEVPRDGSDVLFLWRFAGGPGSNQGAGGRSGKLNGDKYYSTSSYRALGDPHGSVCVIEFVVPAELAQPGSVPNVQVLVTSGPLIRCTSGGSFSFVAPDLVDDVAGPAANLVWAAMDLLTWGNISTAQIDPVSWAAAAAIAATSVSYVASDGSTKSHAQFKASFALPGTSRQALSAALTALRNAGNLMIGPNNSTGLIQCFIKQTLADQQPSAVSGSNDTTSRSSVHADGSSGNGFYAYLFDETNIDKDSFKITTTRIESTPNTVAFAFQDEYNQYQQDSLTEIDPNSYAYSGNQEIASPVPINAVPNFDQGTRVANTQLAEALYGNPRNDPGGTLYFEFTTNHRVLHLTGRLGFICGLRWRPCGIGVSAPQPVRILSLKPDTDGEHWQVKCAWHNDNWYTYAYGQNPTPFQGNPLLNPPQRPPYPWKPGQAVFLSSDALFPSRKTFDIDIDVSQYPAQLTVSGAVPVSAQPSTLPPLVPLQASTANSGGSIPPGTYHIAFSTNGVNGPVSAFITAVVPVGTNTNTITVSGIQWRSGAAPSILPYIGRHSLTMVAADGSSYSGSSPDTNGNPTGYTFTALTTDGYGLPDVNFSEFLVEETGIVHGGVWGDSIYSVDMTGLTLSFPEASWTLNQFTGRILSLYYRPGASPQPVLDIAVVANGATTLAVAATGFQAGDVVVLRSKATTFSANTIGDSKYLNSYAISGLDVNEEVGNLVYIIAGTGAGQAPRTVASNTSTVLTINGTFDVTPDATSIFVVLSPTLAYSYTTNPIPNTGGSSEQAVATTPAITSQFQSLFIRVATADSNGNTAPMRFQPYREIYVPNQSMPVPTVNVTGDITLQPIAQAVEADATAAVLTVTLPPFSKWLGRDIIITKVDSSSNAVNWALAAGDSIPGIGTSGSITAQGSSITVTATSA